MKAMKTFLFILGTAIVGFAATIFAGATAWLRKSKAQEAAEALSAEIEKAKVAEEFRHKVADAVAAKAVAEAEKEKAHDTVDNANSLIASLSEPDSNG